ncbi:MAG: glycosyltransferase family 4 protein [Myxococcota bacterium]
MPQLSVLALTRYGTRAAGTRYRFAQYEPHLRAAGIDLTVSPLLDNDYLSHRLVSGAFDRASAARGYLRRIRALMGARRFDLLWVHLELMPFLPAWFEELLSLFRIPYVYDFDDAWFHSYDRHRSRVVRRLLGNKIADVIGSASAVTAGSPYLYEYAARFSQCVYRVPTVVDMERYRPSRSPSSTSERLRVGWIGSPSSSQYLAMLRGPLRRLAECRDVELRTIGAAHIDVIPGVPLDARAWSEETELEDLGACDVGVMPLTSDPWSRGKCSFKLIQYMALGLPVVASPVGMNTEVVTPEVGFLPRSENEWLEALETIAAEPQMRARMGKAGRDRAEEAYSLQALAPHVVSILRRAAEG